MCSPWWNVGAQAEHGQLTSSGDVIGRCLLLMRTLRVYAKEMSETCLQAKACHLGENARFLRAEGRVRMDSFRPLIQRHRLHRRKCI